METQERAIYTNLEDARKARLEQAYTELGKAYYEGGFEDPLPQLLPLFDEITRLRAKEEDSEKAAPEGRFCVNCGSRLEAGEVFCGNCGAKVEP